MVSIFCDDLRKIRKFKCCPGCHAADESGEMDLATANFNVEGESIFAHGCCRSGVCHLKAEELGPAIEHRKQAIEQRRAEL